MTIRQELEKISGTVQRKDESENSYLERLIEVVYDETETDKTLWDKLSKEAKNWVNKAWVASDIGKDIPVFTDVVKEIHESKSITTEVVKLPEKTKEIPMEKLKTENVSIVKKEKVITKKENVSIKSKDDNKVTCTTRIKEIMCNNPSISTKDVISTLQSENYTFKNSSVASIYTHTKQVLNILIQMKKL